MRFLLLSIEKNHWRFKGWFRAAGTNHTNQRAHLGDLEPRMPYGKRMFSFLPKLQRVTQLKGCTQPMIYHGLDIHVALEQM